MKLVAVLVIAAACMEFAVADEHDYDSCSDEIERSLSSFKSDFNDELSDLINNGRLLKKMSTMMAMLNTLVCPHGTFLYDSCFFVLPTATTFQGAQTACQAKGGRLAYITDDNFNAVANYLRKFTTGGSSYFRFGATYSAQSRSITYLDGSSAYSLRNRWHPGYPYSTAGTSMIIQIHASTFWSTDQILNYGDSYPQRPICQKWQ